MKSKVGIDCYISIKSSFQWLWTEYENRLIHIISRRGIPFS